MRKDYYRPHQLCKPSFISMLLNKLLKIIKKSLKWLFYGYLPDKQPCFKLTSLGLTIMPEGLTIEGLDMNITIRKKQELRFNPVFRDEDGNVTTDLGSIPVWTSSNPAVLVVQASEDGQTAVARPTGALGTAQVRLSVDADPGEDVAVLVGTLDVEVRAGLAIMIELNPSVHATVVDVPVEEPAPVVVEPAPADEPAQVQDPVVEQGAVTEEVVQQNEVVQQDETATEGAEAIEPMAPIDNLVEQEQKPVDGNVQQG